jgi:alkanesulfonate monooxygenase SsuD/methylene tetrahydromethanopterin reductase-like flavin-dependent oxidoreductase (luciferase family)
VVVAPLHHPAELAEQAAIVDLVSAGRLDLGIGAGYRVPEFDLFGADLARRYAATDECARELRRLWSDGGVTPRPVQTRPTIWMGYQGPKGARRCGLLGESLLSADPSQWPHYRGALLEGGHDVAQARMAGAVQAWTTNDPERDWPVVAKHLAHQRDSYRRYGVEGTDAPVPRPVDPERIRERDPRGPIDYLRYGTPDDIAGWVGEHTAGAPVETVLVWASLSGMPEAMVAEHVRVVCTELAPRLAGLSTPTEGAG